jgi:hypothetical protein
VSNFPATLAAVAARGPRCDVCGQWTYLPGEARNGFTPVWLCRTHRRTYPAVVTREDLFLAVWQETVACASAS